MNGDAAEALESIRDILAETAAGDEMGEEVREILAHYGVTDVEVALTVLDVLRESSLVNMYSAAPFLRQTYGLRRSEARKVLTYWMRTFTERAERQDRLSKIKTAIFGIDSVTK